MIYTRDNPKSVKCKCCFKNVETFTGVVKDKNNTIAYYINGKLHREDVPAVEHSNGTKEWCLNGKFHREDGPAIENVNGYKEWCLNGTCYGINNDFTNESWIRFVQLELLK